MGSPYGIMCCGIRTTKEWWYLNNKIFQLFPNHFKDIFLRNDLQNLISHLEKRNRFFLQDQEYRIQQVKHFGPHEGDKPKDIFVRDCSPEMQKKLLLVDFYLYNDEVICYDVRRRLFIIQPDTEALMKSIS
jgi:hypothetical protein